MNPEVAIHYCSRTQYAPTHGDTVCVPLIMSTRAQAVYRAVIIIIIMLSIDIIESSFAIVRIKLQFHDIV